MVNAVVAWMSEMPQELSLDCRHSGQQVQFKTFDRTRLNAELRAMRRSKQTKRKAAKNDQ